MECKWPILFDDNLTAAEKAKLWEGQHQDGYSRKVWSVTQDSAIRQKLISKIRHFSNVSRILVPGCGSEVYLQNDLATQLSGIQNVTCTDYPAVVALASDKTNNSLITYEARDSSNLGWENEWDVIIVVNSVLSSSDEENRRILRSFCDALRPGGAVIGYFPTIFAAFEISTLDPAAITGSIDVRKCVFYEERQRMHQIFYTPLRIRRILKEAGLRLAELELVFFDGKEHFVDHSKDYYGLDDPDLAVYEMLIVAIKDSDAITDSGVSDQK